MSDGCLFVCQWVSTPSSSCSQRAKLLQLAEERGLKGFSELVQEAIDEYLKADAARRDRIAAAMNVLGFLSEEEAKRLGDSVAKARRTWRIP